MPKRLRCRSSALRPGLASRILRKTGVGLKGMADSINRVRRDLLALGALAAVGWRQAAFVAREAADAPPSALSELVYGHVRFSDGPLQRQTPRPLRSRNCPMARCDLAPARCSGRRARITAWCWGLTKTHCYGPSVSAQVFPHRARNSAAGTTPTPSRPAPRLDNG